MILPPGKVSGVTQTIKLTTLGGRMGRAVCR